MIDGTCTATCEAGTQTRKRDCVVPGADRCLESDGITRSLEELDSTITCNLGTCAGKCLNLKVNTHLWRKSTVLIAKVAGDNYYKLIF